MYHKPQPHDAVSNGIHGPDLTRVAGPQFVSVEMDLPQRHRQNIFDVADGLDLALYGELRAEKLRGAPREAFQGPGMESETSQGTPR